MDKYFVSYLSIFIQYRLKVSRPPIKVEETVDGLKSESKSIWKASFNGTSEAQKRMTRMVYPMSLNGRK